MNLLREHINVVSILTEDVPEIKPVELDVQPWRHGWIVSTGEIAEFLHENSEIEVIREDDALTANWYRGANNADAFLTLSALIEDAPEGSMFILNGTPMLFREQALKAVKRLSEET